MCPPHHEPPLPPPSRTYLSMLSHSSSFGCHASCINLTLVIVLHMVIFMFQCSSLKSSHPFLLPLSPKVCSLHLCLICCPACRIISTILLNFMYMCYYTVFVILLLTYFTIYVVVVVAQSFICVQFFATPWITACQASLSFTIFQSLLKLISTESVMPSNYLSLCHPLLLLPSIFPSIKVSSNESTLQIRWPKYWTFVFIISPSKEYS